MKPLTPENQDTLKKLCHEINEREQAISQLKKSTEDYASQAVAEAILQGQCLIKARSMVPGRQFKEWLICNCPQVRQRQAYNYIKVASSVQRDAQIAGASSIRQALLLCDEPEQSEPKPKQEAPPAYIVALNKINALVKFEADHPVKEWPDEGKEEARKMLKPLAAELWVKVE